MSWHIHSTGESTEPNPSQPIHARGDRQEGDPSCPPLPLSLSPNKEDRRQAASNAYAGTRTQSAVMIVIIRKGLIYVRTEYYSLQSPRVYSV